MEERGEVRAEPESGAGATVVVVVVAVAVVEVAVAPLRLVVPRRFLPAGPVASVLALALTLTADLDLALAFAILAVVAGMAVLRETPDSDGGGGDPIVAVVEKVLPSDEDPTWTVVIMSSLLFVVVPVVAVAEAEAFAALWTAERASENADCSVATLQSAFSGVGPPMRAIAPHLRRGGGRGMEVVVLVDPMVAMVEVLLRPVRAGADDGGLAASVRGEWEPVVVVGVEGGPASEPRRVGTSRASKSLDPASRIDERDGATFPRGSAPSSTSLQSGSFLLFPFGTAHTPSWGGRPSAWRQRGAARPKRGTDECIVSSRT